MTMHSTKEKEPARSSERRHHARGFALQNVHWLWLSFFVLLADQVSMRLVIEHLGLFKRIPLLSVLNITRMHNNGEAFSLFAEAAPFMFSLLAVFVSLVIFICLLLLAYY